MSKKTGGDGKGRLIDSDIVTARNISRRRALLGIGAGIAGSVAATIVVAGPAQALTDSDSGSCADQANFGRGTTGVTDSDAGKFSDPAGNGRYTGWSDADAGGCADPANQGRGQVVGRGNTNPTDSDSGTWADPAGQGRAGVRTGRSDSDRGGWRDPPGGGRWGSGYTDSDGGPSLTDTTGNGRRGF